MSRPESLGAVDTLASGIFKFSDNVRSATLVLFADKTWKPDSNFLELSVRGCDGNRRSGIAFRYLHSGDKEDFDRFIDQCVGRLTRIFGKDFVGWDISSWT